MKVLFAGPSLAGVSLEPGDVELRPPAKMGDVTAAVLDGATAVGLVDGGFEQVASVWHKEILFALSSGVRVFGASCIGALRAVECAPWGMIGVGAIFRRYESGELDDDAAVALLHAPQEFGWLPFTEPLVDAEATLSALTRQGALPEALAGQLLAAARWLNFRDRTVEAIVVGAGLADRAEELVTLYEEHRISQKGIDALELLQRLKELPDLRRDPPSKWQHGGSFFARHFLDHANMNGNLTAG